MTRHRLLLAEPPHHVFPPALVPVLRDHMASRGDCLAHVSDDTLVELLTTIFWAGLETYEGRHLPVGVVFLGTSTADFVTPAGSESESAPLYQWKILRFTATRPFDIGELVKLAVAGTDRRIYTAVSLLQNGKLVIAGLAREGFNAEPDPFVKVIAAHPGSLSIRSGSDLLVGYERGTTLTEGGDAVFVAGPVRHRLQTMARAAGLDEDVVPEYVKAVRALVREMAAHGRGGILVISEEHHALAHVPAYHMKADSSLASLLQLSHHLGGTESGDQQKTKPDDGPFRHMLRNTFLTETERVVEEVGALTAIDGAVLLNRDLALVAFGVILPLRRTTPLALSMVTEHVGSQRDDLGSRGTRHRAGATYAAEHPGDVVFVASEDGALSCIFRDTSHDRARLWRLGATDRSVG
jgi:sensor domain DACNV-containing protein